MRKTNITLTGIDANTPLDGIMGFGGNVELAFLFTVNPEGRKRYPTMATIREFTEFIPNNLALHVCGGKARSMLYTGALKDFCKPFHRIQVNGNVDMAELTTFCAMFPEKTIITQHHHMNVGLRFSRLKNHSILIDGSGGRGILPASWPYPESDQPVGFAGGLGPDNLLEEVPKILKVAKEGWWADMESGLRDADDWFSVEKAFDAVRLFDKATTRITSTSETL